MLHYKKSRHNLYEQLDYLGLNSYEQKHFCFEGAGSGEGGEGGGFGGMEDAAGAEDTTGIDAVGPGPGPGIQGPEDPTGVEAAGRASPATQAQLDAQQEVMGARSAAEKAEGLQDLMDMGIYGYNDAVDKGFVDAIERAERDFDTRQAYDIAAKYGLDPSQVQPGFMQDPSLGPQTMSYTGPGSFNAATSEMATAAGMLAANLVDMTPGLFGLARGLAGFGRKDSFAGLVGQARGQSRDEQAESLSSKVESYMNKDAASQRESNMAARGVTETEQASAIDRSQPQSSTDYFDAPQTLSQQFASAPEAYEFGPNYGLAPSPEIDVQQVAGPFTDLPSQPQSAVDYYDVPTSQQQSSASDLFSDIPDGNEIIPRTVSKTPAATPTPEPAVEVVRAPVTRRPATDTFSILERIYGPDVAAKLLPTRIV
jgi:hypothetical protein